MSLKTNYLFDDTAQIWKRASEQTFGYSDGDTIETRLLDILRQADDRSVFSEELRHAMTDWPSTYHLSSSRSNLLRPLERTLLKNARLLELGCGCGAVTRYLGEAAGEVVAIDGSVRRATIAAARCQDLPNVTVIADTISMLPEDIGLFDVVTLIGVLEYAHLFGVGPDPALELLEKARSFLKPGGALILAIENKLGLKYLAGVPEDHLGTSWTGVLNAYNESGVRTWSRSELIHLLTVSDYTDISQFVPLPDYKLPTTVISPTGLVARPEEFKQAPLMALRTRVFEEQPLFNTMQAWESVCAANLLPELADSLCFVAQAGANHNIRPWDDAILAYHYGSPYVPNFAAKEMCIERTDAGLRVKRRKLLPEPNVAEKNSGIQHRVEDEPYFSGDLLFSRCRKVLTRRNWTASQLAETLRPWLDWLKAQATAEGLLVPGNLIDATPFNMMTDDSGRLTFFDREWVLERPISLSAIFLRGLLATYRMLGPVAPPAKNTPTDFWRLAEEVCRCLGLPDALDAIKKALEEGLYLEDALHGAASLSIEDIGDLRLQIMIESSGQLQTLCIELEDLRSEVAGLNSANDSLFAPLSRHGSKSLRFAKRHAGRAFYLTWKVVRKIVQIARIIKTDGPAKAYEEVSRVVSLKAGNMRRAFKSYRKRLSISPPKLLAVGRITATASVPDAALHSINAGEVVDIGWRCLKGTGYNFTGKQAVVMAVSEDFDENSPLAYLCRHLKQLGRHIIIVLPSEHNRPGEQRLFSPYDAVLSCDQPDPFACWKAALEAFPSLLDSSELILCDDSVYGGLTSHAPMHEAMDKLKCDFWGPVESFGERAGLQNWYLVFKPNTLRHTAFSNFFSDYRSSHVHTESLLKQDLTAFLISHGLKPGVFAPTPKRLQGQDSMLALWRPLLEHGLPFLSRRLLTGSNPDADRCDWPHVLRAQGYPVELIFWDCIKREMDITTSIAPGTRSRVWPPDVFTMRKDVHFAPDDPEAYMEYKESIGAFAHVYYVEQLPELAGYLQNLPNGTPLHISTDTEEKVTIISDILNSFNLMTQEIRVVPNKGFDIAPFFIGFADRINEYDYIVKVHAKKSPQMKLYTSDPEKMTREWRTLLYSPLLGSKERVRQILSFFRNNPDFGMLAPPSLPFYASLGLISQSTNHSFLKRLLQPYNVPLQPDTAIDFPMGTMFWCKPEALKPWLDMKFQFDDFEEADSLEKRDGSLAHALERALFLGCAIQGLHWGRVFPVSQDA